MAIQQTNNPFEDGQGTVDGYVFAVVGDGVSTTADLDLLTRIAGDQNILNKQPTGIANVNSPIANLPTATISGTIVTLTWATPLGNGQIQSLGIKPTFPL